jgi:hypothetical protein
VQVEAVARLRKPELLDEQVGQLPVVVLPRVHDDLVDPRRQERHGQGRALDELGTVSDDGEDFHSAAAYSGRCLL